MGVEAGVWMRANILNARDRPKGRDVPDIRIWMNAQILAATDCRTVRPRAGVANCFNSQLRGNHPAEENCSG
jgi:hypothetical protein